MNHLIHLTQVDSTQTYIKDNVCSLDVFDSCFATTQTNGYGRNGSWNSDFENLYFSKLLPIDKYNHLSAITAMHMLMAKYTPLTEIKVPNDLFAKGSKLGGLIIENIDGYAILGIGININGAPQDFQCLSNLTHNRYSIDSLARELDELIELNLTMPLAMLENYYQTHCNLVGNLVECLDMSDNYKFSGVVTALDSETITIDNCKFNQMQIKILNK